MNIQDYYSKESKVYDLRRIKGYHKHVSTIKINILKEYIKNKNFKVLEVGCGTGIILSNIRGLCKATGIDLTEDMLKIARKKGLNVKMAEATKLPFKDDIFDLVYSFQVLPHVPDIKKAVDEIVRVSKNDGIIIFDLYNKYSFKYMNYFVKEIILRKKTTYIKFFSLNEMKKLLSDLKIVEFKSIRIFGIFGGIYKIEFFARVLDKLDRMFDNLLRFFASHIIIIIKNNKQKRL